MTLSQTKQKGTIFGIPFGKVIAFRLGLRK
jgi:hypothetical protein